MTRSGETLSRHGAAAEAEALVYFLVTRSRFNKKNSMKYKEENLQDSSGSFIHDCSEQPFTVSLGEQTSLADANS